MKIHSRADFVQLIQGFVLSHFNFLLLHSRQLVINRFRRLILDTAGPPAPLGFIMLDRGAFVSNPLDDFDFSPFSSTEGKQTASPAFWTGKVGCWEFMLESELKREAFE